MSRRIKKSAMAAMATAAMVSALPLVGAATVQANPIDHNPDVWYTPYPGGITAHVQSWSPADTDCTYQADWIVRQFHLPGHQFDKAKIGQPPSQAALEFPGFPAFRPWNVSVNCLNGQSTSFVYWY
jgi:hypothetical protein